VKVHTSYMNFCSGHLSKGAGNTLGQGVLQRAAGSIITSFQMLFFLLGSDHNLFCSEDA